MIFHGFFYSLQDSEMHNLGFLGRFAFTWPHHNINKENLAEIRSLIYQKNCINAYMKREMCVHSYNINEPVFIDMRPN